MSEQEIIAEISESVEFLQDRADDLGYEIENVSDAERFNWRWRGTAKTLDDLYLGPDDDTQWLLEWHDGYEDYKSCLKAALGDS